MKALSICISIFLLACVYTSCIFFRGDPAFKVTVTNKTDDELIVYLSPTTIETSDLIGFYLIGIVSPGKTLSKEMSMEIGGPTHLTIFAEKNTGQGIHKVDPVSVSYLESEVVVYARAFTRSEFSRIRHHVTITAPE